MAAHDFTATGEFGPQCAVCGLDKEANRTNRGCPGQRTSRPKRPCTIAGCGRKHLARGLCKFHYQRVSRNGEPDRTPKTVEERFWEKVARGAAEDCWPWLAKLTDGYGHFHPRPGERRRAHRLAFELLVGPIPEGLVLDHLCRNRACCNPAHLEPVTIRENILRGEPANRTHCPHGHAYTPENTRIDNNMRSCRTCIRERARRRRAVANV